MSDIYSAKLLELLPPNLRGDPDIIAASSGVDKEFQAFAAKIKHTLTFADIDSASSEVVDNLARELDTPFYDENLDLVTRQTLVKYALLYNMNKGTPAAVEKLLKDVFGQSRMQEWFEYSGDPYQFCVIFTPFNSHSALRGFRQEALTQYTHEQINNMEQQAEVIAKLTGAIDSVKNIRSYFEGFFVYGSHASQRSFNHDFLTAYTHERLTIGEPMNVYGTYVGLKKYSHAYLKLFTNETLRNQETLN